MPREKKEVYTHNCTLHGCSSEEVNGRVVRKLIWRSGGAILDMYPVVDNVLIIHNALIVHPIPRLLDLVSIRTVACINSQPCAQVDKNPVRNGIFIVISCVPINLPAHSALAGVIVP